MRTRDVAGRGGAAQEAGTATATAYARWSRLRAREATPAGTARRAAGCLDDGGIVT